MNPALSPQILAILQALSEQQRLPQGVPGAPGMPRLQPDPGFPNVSPRQVTPFSVPPQRPHPFGIPIGSRG